MSNVTREEVIELLRNFQQRMAAKRGMCDEHDGALWDNAESVIAALQAAEPAAWLFPDMTWTPISAMGRDHKGKEVFALPCPPAKAQVPEGWKLVPVEPTDHMSDVGMVSAGIDITENDARHVYSAMLDASPQPAPTAVPEGWHISRTEGGNIIVQKSHVAGFVASEQGGGIAESTLYYLADDLLNAPLNPEHSGDSNEMPGWEPIETAPMDGTHIQLYRPKTQFIGYYGGANSGWRHNAPGLDEVWPLPTHWMPLLNPPQQEGAER